MFDLRWYVRDWAQKLILKIIIYFYYCILHNIYCQYDNYYNIYGFRNIYITHILIFTWINTYIASSVDRSTNCGGGIVVHNRRTANNNLVRYHNTTKLYYFYNCTWHQQSIIENIYQNMCVPVWPIHVL